MCTPLFKYVVPLDVSERVSHSSDFRSPKMAEEDYEDDSEYESDSDAFEAPPVLAVEQPFRVLSPEECLAKAQEQVDKVVELLCCDAQVAQLLLRHFCWDRERLTDGVPHGAACPPTPVPATSRPAERARERVRRSLRTRSAHGGA